MAVRYGEKIILTDIDKNRAMLTFTDVYAMAKIKMRVRKFVARIRRKIKNKAKA